jgi:hypothetical protein
MAAGSYSEQPDLTLDEVVVAMRKQRIGAAGSAVWWFFNRTPDQLQKKPTGCGGAELARNASILDAGAGHV